MSILPLSPLATSDSDFTTGLDSFIFIRRGLKKEEKGDPSEGRAYDEPIHNTSLILFFMLFQTPGMLAVSS